MSLIATALVLAGVMQKWPQVVSLEPGTDQPRTHRQRSRGEYRSHAASFAHASDSVLTGSLLWLRQG